MNAVMPRSGESDVRIYSEAELRGILGTWFSHVTWEKAGDHGCLATAVK